MDIQRVLQDSRDPQSKNNIFRELYAEYKAAELHARGRGIEGFPVKTLERSLLQIRKEVAEIRYGKDPEAAAERCLELLHQSKTMIQTLLSF